MNPTMTSHRGPDGESRRVEYRVQGLSCPNCTREMQEEIQRLEHGQNASLLYNSGRLLIDPAVDLQQVERILKGDGAKLIQPDLRSPDETAVSANAADEGPSPQAAAETASAGEPEEEHENRLGLWLLVLSAVMYGVTFVPAIPGTVGIGLDLAAIVFSGYSTFQRGLRNLIRLKFNMDTLMTVALTGAVIIGEWKEATLVAILFGLNELLEGYGMSRARRSLSALLEAAPKEAVVVQDGRESVVPIARLKVGDVVLVRAGEKIPSDGTVLEGSSAVNEAAITGESIPVTKGPGQPVFGGSINSEGLLRIRIDKPYEDSSLAKIMQLVQEAQDKKTPTELFIDRFAKWYTPAIMVLAALVMFVPPLLFGQPWMNGVYDGLAILIVGCPCALVLSSPIALVSGMTRCARLGVLVKGGVHLEQLGKVSAIAFDKTGTLTKGQPEVQREIAYDPQRFHAVAAALESGSLHPLAAAVVRYVAARSGIAARSGVTEWHAGLLPEQKVAQIQALSGHGTVAMVGDGINDAPALAAADLGIAMGQGTDSAVETADIVLMQDHLGQLPRAIRIARRAGRIIACNIGLSLSLKLIALLLTIPGWLTLWIAVMSDMGATIIVTLLGLTVLLGKDPKAGNSPAVEVASRN
ncbi:cadmium family heavy metal-translocating P-type ATPase [Paenibacillus rubinfantis]|uniref:cadmium family heavy metal-translocating P-type ATPase n=1 Tax=Paenibacillus rubinfantis TaxID=1720296 RepID=UPI00073E8FCD|nr:cadmium family heavy metal-translocating P-type ATPase [Paenibacillus rubinfantis]